MNWINYLTVFCVIIIANLVQIECSGVFELKLNTFLNANGKNNQNLCCSGRQDPTTGKCIGTCKTRFRVCLKHYQAKIDTTSPCTFGDVSTPVVGDNNVDLTQLQQNISINPIQFPFDFTWPGTFTLIIEAWHTSSSNETLRSSDSLISRIAIQRVLDVKQDWTPDSHESTLEKSITFQYRVTCDPHYYGAGCAKLCRGRDDSFGHYTCSAAGERVCQTGWTGEYCEKPRCLPGCDESHGHCNKPNECICQAGWKGKLCDECEPYPGCVHGTCKTPWQCICKEGWGGLFCNQDLNYCTNHRPCLNGGTCFNTGEGLYTCKCPPGFTGTECQNETSDCSLNPCQNGGTCTELTKGYKCDCHKGWIGKHCEDKTVTCAENPCLHGSKCTDTKLGFKCDCPLGYIGKSCETQVNECSPNPCENGGKCVNKGADYKCMCPSGFQGTRCEINIDDCQGNPCRNGGSCVDMVNQFRCQCVPGFIGSTCENKVDLCLTKPCANGGICKNLNNDYECTCRPGFTGKDCSVDIDECSSNPCKNGATCVNRVNSFQCVCAGGFRGKTCNDEALALATFDSGSSSRHVAETETASNDGLSGGQIALIAIFSIAMPLTAFIAAAVVICMKRRRKREQEKDDAEARKQNEQNASHISRIHHGSINLKRNSNSGNCDMAPHVIKNTWDKSVNNITNSQSMDDCLMNSSLYGGLSSYSDNSANECYQQQQQQQQQLQQTPSINEMHRAKSQKQLNTDPIKMMHRASQIITQSQSPSPPNTQQQQTSATTKDQQLTSIYDMKRISVLSDAALCNTRWPTNVSPLPRQLVGAGSPHCSPPHM